MSGPHLIAKIGLLFITYHFSYFCVTFRGPSNKNWALHNIYGAPRNTMGPAIDLAPPPKTPTDALACTYVPLYLFTSLPFYLFTSLPFYLFKKNTTASLKCTFSKRETMSGQLLLCDFMFRHNDDFRFLSDF